VALAARLVEAAGRDRSPLILARSPTSKYATPRRTVRVTLDRDGAVSASSVTSLQRRTRNRRRRTGDKSFSASASASAETWHGKPWQGLSRHTDRLLLGSGGGWPYPKRVQGLAKVGSPPLPPTSARRVANPTLATCRFARTELGIPCQPEKPPSPPPTSTKCHNF